MADNFGVLGSSVATAVATATVYTCPANKAAKVKIMASFQGGAASTISVLVNNVQVALIAAMTVNHFTFTNGGAGLLRAAAATAPTGASAAETVQPAAPIYYLSAGQTVQYTVGATALIAANCQVVGLEVDLTA
jgi:hypothetical protein